MRWPTRTPLQDLSALCARSRPEHRRIGSSLGHYSPNDLDLSPHCAVTVLSFPAMADTFNNPTPQFGTAEYIGKPGNDHCQFCHQPIAGNYYRINGAMVCAGCAEKMRGVLAKELIRTQLTCAHFCMELAPPSRD